MFIILLLFLLACLYSNSSNICTYIMPRFKQKCENQEKRTQGIDSDRKKEKFNFFHICQNAFLGVLVYKFLSFISLRTINW